MSETEVLKAAAARAIDYIEGLEDVRVGARLTAGELRARLGKPLADAGLPAQQVIEELAHDVTDGLLSSTNGRFFGWVMGGALPVAIAADWLTRYRAIYPLWITRRAGARTGGRLGSNLDEHLKPSPEHALAVEGHRFAVETSSR